MKTKDIMMYALIAGGVYGLYWYVTHYGTNGSVNDVNGNRIPGAVSWWDSWFGSTTAAHVTAPAPTQQTQTGQAQPILPAAPPPVQQPAAASVSLAGPVTPDVNNSLKAAVVVNGQTMTLNVIPSSGAIYNTSGQNVTSQFPANVAQQIIQVMVLGASTSTPAAGSGSTPMATADQIATIRGLLRASDIPAFMTMVAQGLTMAQASQMIQNATVCKTTLPPAPGIPAGSGVSTYDVASNACGAPIQPTAGMGDITPTRAMRSSTASPTLRSPWGRIAAADGGMGGMNWKN